MSNIGVNLTFFFISFIGLIFCLWKLFSADSNLSAKVSDRLESFTNLFKKISPKTVLSRGSKSKIENGLIYKTSTFLRSEDVDLQDDLEEEYEDESEDTEECEHEEQITSDSETSDIVDIKPVRKKKRKSTKFFESKELIDCISVQSSNSKISARESTYFDKIATTIEEKLAEFKVTANVINILKGPVVDTFELELGEGIKVSKVKNLSEDVGLALMGVPIRMVYPMSGKSTIGVEVPRKNREIIYLDEVLKSREFKKSEMALPIAMGKNAFGETTVVNLASMPHMLVAGATGAGKSVFINTLLVSLIIKRSPEEMKLILIDPKQLELALYQDLPHLMLPVMTQPQESSIALLWAVDEMERRYSILKEMSVKNIDGFNKKVKTADRRQIAKIQEHYDEDVDRYELPYLVIVVDEFADLMLTKMGKEIETNISRLAAKARAAGIHIVLATQRPSTDVITGVIKSNFPTRVSFRVSSNMDSRVVLDQTGAEKLLGKGDMLFKQGVETQRVHSAYVDEEEIEVLVEKLSHLPHEFNSSAMEFVEKGGEESFEDQGVPGVIGGPSEKDPYYEEAVRVVIEQGSASASMIQRRLRVGYNRAANLIDQLELNGIVGPAQGSKPRKILVSGSNQ